ncbi:Uncharacterized protein FWK35_00025915, partial [Aphis craccivora]
HFFGIVRRACGSNQHPDPKQFVQIYRLISSYSLIKPPSGSNVSGGDILKILIDIKPTNEEDIQKKADLEIILDNLLDNGEFEVLSDHLYFENENQSNIDKSALTYFVGYVAPNAKKNIQQLKTVQPVLIQLFQATTKTFPTVMKKDSLIYEVKKQPSFMS